MKGEITISDNGAVAVPSEVKMSIDEIAYLFGIFYQTAKSAIRAIEESGVSCGDYSAGGTAEGMKIYPDYYGLDMVMAVAFRVQSARAQIFRRWVIARLAKEKQYEPQLYIRLSNNNNAILN